MATGYARKFQADPRSYVRNSKFFFFEFFYKVHFPELSFQTVLHLSSMIQVKCVVTIV
jgi:hypothetical protein